MPKCKSSTSVLVRVIALLLSLSLVLSSSACLPLVVYDFLNNETTAPAPESVSFEAEGNYNDLTFEELCDVLFKHEVVWDNLTLNQLVVDPAALDIEVPRPATLGDNSYEGTVEDNQFYTEILEALTGGHTIDVTELTEEQQLSYKFIEKNLRETIEYQAFFYYSAPLCPSNGAQAALPLNLMDYNFRTLDDIEIYLELLADVPRYFDELVEHEKQKKEHGVMMPQESMEDSIDEAYAYIGDAETHILTTAFNEMIDEAISSSAEGSELAGLSEEQIQAYKDRNYTAVDTSVIPAYSDLVVELEALLPSCKQGTRLYDYARGTEYYELELESMGFTGGATQAISDLEGALADYWSILASNPYTYSLEEDIPESVVQAIGDTPESYISYIQEHSSAEFAPAGDLSYRIKIAPDASPNDYAMAYFMIPPVDDAQHNIIVYFPRNISDDVELYNTMAHEGYPGHMYQFYAYSLEEPSNVSKILGSSAYVEGWAMYAQARAMYCLDYDIEAIESFVVYEKFSYGLQARVDLGVNFEGWDVRDTERYLETWGFELAAQDLYDASIQQPVAYLPYGLGVIEFDNLRYRAESQLGESFDAVSFHHKITSLGPVSFDLLESQMEAWFKSYELQEV